VIQVAVLESAMAPMITACILASTHGLKPRLSSMMIGFGIPLSLRYFFGIFWFSLFECFNASSCSLIIDLFYYI
jgi:predicted permease